MFPHGSTPIFTGDGEGGSGFAAAAAAAAAGGVAGFDFGVDPNLDPELALALRVSMEEERARQEAAAKKAAEEASRQEKEGEQQSSSQDATMTEHANVAASDADKKSDLMVCLIFAQTFPIPLLIFCAWLPFNPSNMHICVWGWISHFHFVCPIF